MNLHKTLKTNSTFKNSKKIKETNESRRGCRIILAAKDIITQRKGMKL